jgi:type IV secretion system protein VirB9
MDPGRLLILAATALALQGCATLSHLGLGRPSGPAPVATAAAVTATPAATAPASLPPARPFASMAPIPNPGPARSARSGALASSEPALAARRVDPSGPAAIAAANTRARELSRARGFLGGVQVFGYEPGRVYEVWTAPLRVTTLSLSAGETVVSKAAGDTVRWQIGETESGEGPTRRSHVMVKPLERGLETNLVLATNRRIYLVQLRSGAPDAFNAVVTWDAAAALDDGATELAREVAPTPTLVTPQGPLDARFRIKPRGRAPPWTPNAVMTDGVRTFLSFPATATAGEMPALFAVGPDGSTQFLNYRQQQGLWVVDRVLDAAELRIGAGKAQVVRIERVGARS